MFINITRHVTPKVDSRQPSDVDSMLRMLQVRPAIVSTVSIIIITLSAALNARAGPGFPDTPVRLLLAGLPKLPPALAGRRS